MKKATLLKSDATTTVDADWGRIRWYSSGALGNSSHVTVGSCVLRSGFSNPLHYHTTSEEVLIVVRGRIAHTLAGGDEVVMEPGDVITIPPEMPHQARNIGDEDAILTIVYPTADRDFVPIKTTA